MKVHSWQELFLFPPQTIVVQLPSHIWLCDPMNCSMPGFLSFTISLSLLKLMSIESTISYSVVPFSSCPPSFPALGSFPVTWLFASGGQNIELQHQSFQWIFRVISFRIDWFDVLVVQGTLKSFLQHHSLKTLILQCSALNCCYILKDIRGKDSSSLLNKKSQLPKSLCEVVISSNHTAYCQLIHSYSPLFSLSHFYWGSTILIITPNIIRT